MRTLTALAIILSLTTTAIAAPRRKQAAKAQKEAALKACVHEHTGPTGGITVSEATRQCRSTAKATAAVTKARKAIAACEQAVSDACVDGAAADGSTDCMAPSLFAACHTADPE